jgi:hypothetical protein
MMEKTLTVTIKQVFDDTLIAGTSAQNYNFRSTTFDAATGSFVTYGNTNAGIIKTLG